MWVVGLGLILNLAACVASFSQLLHHVGNQPAANFFATFLVMWAFLIIGFIMLLANRLKGGVALLAIGSLLFVGANVVLFGSGVFVIAAVVVAILTIVGAVRVARRRAA
ncbi:hypothetical protein [Paraburkholderia unamae]|uniref:Uncharacterized protein n=1 Tax=Paraburkholderia unamae TaxID=219649 RepID=A0ABX5KG40_9BURK|nr:hypothetical protein [Paraburkholderia unamae]PVX74030.1 hypothetical protein C7402_12017 [Paraburkholderia unamae]RAR55655.1 hypothetical protein C7401_12117 [Paraburkholderia unamae]CAG9271891.1 conserved membrane hypothetical protein [Paraburkholderia unamae]